MVPDFAFRKFLSLCQVAELTAPCNRRSTRTLQSEDLEFVNENDRVYGNEIYYLPCDQAEQDRLAIQHQVFLYALKGKLTTTTITSATRRILDLGTGPGDWAVAIAEQYPHAEVVGLDMAVWDLETTEADSGGGRVTWEIDDLDVWVVEGDEDELSDLLGRYDPFGDPTHRKPMETPSKAKQKDPQTPSRTEPGTPSLQEADPSYNPYILEPEIQPGWNFSQQFDFIHMRNMKGTFTSWEEVYTEIYKNLAPGGWVEIADYEAILPEVLKVAPGTGDEECAAYPFTTCRKLYLAMMQASFKAGRPLGTFYMHPTYLEDAGFKDVKTTYVNVPVGPWPEDAEQKRAGKMFFVVLMESLEAQLMRLLTKHGDSEGLWTPEKVRENISIAQQEMRTYMEAVGENNKTGWIASFKWVIGRKSKNA